jgi:hypothetical protein
VPIAGPGQVEITAPHAGRLVLHDPLPLRRTARLNGGPTLEPRPGAETVIYCWT